VLKRPKRDDSQVIGDLMLLAFHSECERLLLRRLVLSMALAINPDDMPDDECILLSQILDGDDR
jgi:hypothetical protein